MFIDESYVTCAPEIYNPELLQITRCVVTAISIYASPLPEIVINLTKQPDNGCCIPWGGCYDDKTWRISIAPVDVIGLDVREAYEHFNAQYEERRAENLRRIYRTEADAKLARDIILGTKIPISKLSSLPKDLLDKISENPDLLDMSK